MTTSTTASRQDAAPLIAPAEYAQRLERLRTRMEAAGIDAVLLGASESLRYFTGLVWHPSERLLGALVLPTRLVYIVPGFERSRVESLPHVDGEIAAWEEHESAAALVADLAGPAGRVALDDTLPLFAFYPLATRLGIERVMDAAPLLRGLRLRKSPTEIAIIRHAMALTLEVQRRTHAIMQPGIHASEVTRFIDAQHRELGAPEGSSFCIVSFGKATALPHGADGEQTLAAGDVILVDTGCRLDGYHSDLTRTYTLDEPSPEVARIWAVERAAQQAVFEAAAIGAPAGALDAAARQVIEAAGLGPDYRLPGLPHRAGHGLGLEIHEPPYIVRGNDTALEAGMCFSVEPMIVVPDAFGIRLEDHVYMAEDGPRWFTEPAKSPTEPFADA